MDGKQTNTMLPTQNIQGTSMQYITEVNFSYAQEMIN